MRRARIAPAGRSTWRSMSVSSRCTTVTAAPRSTRPRAASRPSRPPPITAARTPGPAAAAMAAQSSGSRKTKEPSQSIPGIGGTRAVDPVQSTSWS